ncbi:MAG: integrase [Enterobacterales bacterium]|jgi:integrase
MHYNRFKTNLNRLSAYIMIKKIEYKVHNGFSSFAFFHHELGILEEPKQYIEALALAQEPLNTIKAVAQDLKTFFEYIYTFPLVSENYKSLKEGGLSKTVLADLILSYPIYLKEGKFAGGFIGEIAKLTGQEPKKARTCSRMLSSVSQFVKDSAILQSELTLMKESGLVNIDVQADIMFSELTKRKVLNQIEANSLITRSMMSGVLSGGPKYVQSSLFKTIGSATDNQDLYNKAFPLDLAEDVIGKISNYRDICLWALLAGGGIRQSEALQLLLSDVNTRKRIVYTINPEDRPLAYLTLSSEQRAQLQWKGRNIKTVYFLEPFKTIFFNTLPKYLIERGRTSCSHKFLFVNLDNENKGKPYFLASNESLNKSFKRAQKKLGMEKTYTLHSFRHYYGTFCRNYLPLEDGAVGLNTATVQSLMGHSSEVSTKGYAIIDKVILESMLAAANNLLLKNKGDVKRLAVEAINYQLSLAEEKLLGIK